jgi:FkbM family methyltransferase
VDIDFSSVSCEEGEIVIGYTHRYPNIPFKYGCTDIIFLIHYKDKDKLLEIPQNILDVYSNKNPLYEIAEDPITEFFYTHWKKVTPKWFKTKEFTLVREPHIYDFIEIGTSDFDTEIQKNDSRVGLSIEPVKYYLERLPNRTRCKKLNMAISNYNGTGNVFFVNDTNIQKYKLPNWVRGCNTINSYHKTVCNLLEKHKLPVEEVIDSYEIKIQTLDKVLLENKVEFVYYLKIDTEGHDVVILKKFCEDIVKNAHFPHIILFESNELTSRKDLDEIIELYGQKGYDLIERGYNTTLNLNLMKLEGKAYFTPALYNYYIDSSIPAYDIKYLPYENNLEDAKQYCIEHGCVGVTYENGIYKVKCGKYIRPCDDKKVISWLYL